MAPVLAAHHAVGAARPGRPRHAPGHHYHFYATPPSINERGVPGMVEEYAVSLENMILKYPEQWFNYYKFWEEQKI